MFDRSSGMLSTNTQFGEAVKVELQTSFRELKFNVLNLPQHPKREGRNKTIAVPLPIPSWSRSYTAWWQHDS
jgi:hypothetical protein